jgi:hypothetical protein
VSIRKIHLDADGIYRPGDRVVGRVEGVRAVGEVRLFWNTCGRGTDELGVVDVQSLSGEGHFKLTLPMAPYSVDGALVSIAWGIEWVDEQGEALDQREIIVSPTGQPVRLKSVKEPRSQKPKGRWWSKQA